MKTRAIALASLNELQEIVETVEEAELEQMQDLILNSNRIFVGAAGRSLLAMKFLAMRLMQIGLKVYLVGEVCTPSIREGDLLLVGSGSGETAGMIVKKRKPLEQKLRYLQKIEIQQLHQLPKLLFN